MESTRDAHGLPALGVLIQRGDDDPVIAASGVRKLGADSPVTKSDLWHIGSAAKSMTATLLATHVRDGEVGFDTTLAQVFPDLAEQFGDEAKRITLAHLLSHSAGLKANPADSAEQFAELVGDTEDPTAQRRKVVAQAVSGELLFTPGSGFSYSNTGYIVAGAVIERLGERATRPCSPSASWTLSASATRGSVRPVPETPTTGSVNRGDTDPPAPGSCRFPPETIGITTPPCSTPPAISTSVSRGGPPTRGIT